MQHCKEIVSFQKRGMPFITVGDEGERCKKPSGCLGLGGRHRPKHQSVLSVSGLLMAQDCAEFPDEPLFTKLVKSGQNFFCPGVGAPDNFLNGNFVTGMSF